MKKLTTTQLRRLYLDFFISKKHRMIESDSLVPANDPSVLFTSAGMNQFKEHFMGRVTDFRRAVSCQKCLRTGDLEEVGRTPFHHTFFEMLGNFSFGDYFKKEAIFWAWEFVTEILQIPKKDLWVSVYEDDDEAYLIWKDQVHIPVDKIKKFGQSDNFWPANAIASGPNGPCGPCSEIYYQKKDGSSVEVWNLVFTQFNRCDGGKLEPLPNKNIDTGMGLERMSSVLQGVDSNFEIDIFVPIIKAVGKVLDTSDQKILRVVADHARAVTFAICDGVLPSNDGRGYVVRKLIRRCVYLTQGLIKEPFVYKIVSSITEVMKDQYPDLLLRRDNIAEIIKAEEDKYIKNILEGGNEKLTIVINDLKKSGRDCLPPEVGLDLYVTYGIAPDFTKERCSQEGVSVDLSAINVLICSEQERSRASSKMHASIFSADKVVLKKSEFVGYSQDAGSTKIVQIIKDSKEAQEACIGDDIYLVLEKTPFYAESGGQVGDTGEIYLKDTDFCMEVSDTKKESDSILHHARVKGSVSLERKIIKVGDEVWAQVDKNRRDAIRRSHTATHLLQSVLRSVLGDHVQQAGSYVEPDRFRFDFTHFKEISQDECRNIEELINDLVLENSSVAAVHMSKDEAHKTGAMALFGEKYADEVRVVSIGGYSKEFCGGTHLESTGQIGVVLLLKEFSVGSGLRRIEALTGKLAYQEERKTRQVLGGVAEKLKTKPQDSELALDEFIGKYKTIEKEFLKLKQKDLACEIKRLVLKADKFKDVSIVIHRFDYFDVPLLRSAVDLLHKEIPEKGVFFLASVQGESGYCVCGLTKDLVKQGMSAKKLLKKALSGVGGSGGGREDFAQGGIGQSSKPDSVLKVFSAMITEELKEAKVK
ncbi:MAG: alanine--tRNA ligase [Candidatus Omnitrophota bacterium]